MDIVPGILVHSLKELKEELSRLSWAKKVHVDIMDGKFVPNKTIQIQTLRKAFPDMDVQIHLMAHNPHRYIDSYARLGAKEFIIHSEATKHANAVLDDIRAAGMKPGLAFNPETKIAPYSEAIKRADLGLVMTVHPGFSGGSFLKRPLRKIDQIKKINPKIKVGVDGGVSLSTCSHVCQAGAAWAVATSAVTLAPNPKKAYGELKKCH